MSALTLRPATEEDLERLVEIHTTSYPSDASFERRKRNFTQAPLGDLRSVRVVERGGRIIAHAKLFDIALWIGGAQLMAGGIGSLAVSPEARRSGVARWLMAALHQELEQRGAALALLYPFRESFYAALGYGTTLPVVTLTVDSEAMARAFPSAPAYAHYDVVPLEGPWLAPARALYDEAARAGSGRFARSEARWAHLLAGETRQALGVVTRGDRALHGYVVFTHECVAANGPQTLIVDEVTARSSPARGALLALLGRQRDQVDAVEMRVPWGDALVMAFQDAPGARRGTPSVIHPIGQIGAGPMVKLIDVPRALEQRGYRGEGDLTLRCAGEVSAMQLAVRGGRGSVSILPQGVSCEIEVPCPVLGSIVASGMRPSEAAALNLLVGADLAIAKAEQLFAGPRFEALDPF